MLLEKHVRKVVQTISGISEEKFLELRCYLDTTQRSYLYKLYSMRNIKELQKTLNIKLKHVK
eukprot:8957918-Heterocapsa_arctica.AAC.1